uniref:Pyrin domain-containing protein n=1 Tax=Chelydra serpentina TaxID=8475 RepID=A0A8C3T430_CHESE
VVKKLTLRDHLLKTLEDLGEDELKKFKFKLHEMPLKEGYEHIGRGTLRKVDVIDLTDKLISCYEGDYAVEVTVEALKSINERDLAEKLAVATGNGKWPPLETSAPIPEYSSLLGLLSFLTPHWLQNRELPARPHLSCSFFPF